MLLTLVLIATAATGHPCAAIDNTSNAAAWTRPGAPVTTHYRDEGDWLRFDARVPSGRSLEALKRAEDSLSIGAPGPKVVLACA